MKKKENGNFLSFTDLRKYKNVILWAASMAEERLPTTFYEEIENFLKGYKKELVKARRDSNTDERAADPISFALYHRLLTWSVKSNNIFVWFWTLAQWNFMARCASVDPLGFHNFSLGADSLICKYTIRRRIKMGKNSPRKIRTRI
jgi:hypothetical protein